MNHRRLRTFVFSTGLLGLAAAALPAAEPVSEGQRIADRYALTKTRINVLLGPRLNRTALPANPPNPFYQVQKDLATDTPGGEQPVETALVPEAADLSDGDTLKKYAATLKIGGVINRNGGTFLIINGTPFKAGDTFPAGNRNHPVYLKVISLAPNELMLGLNEATLAVPLKN